MSGKAIASPVIGTWPKPNTAKATSFICRKFSVIFAGSSPVFERYGPATRTKRGLFEGKETRDRSNITGRKQGTGQISPGNQGVRIGGCSGISERNLLRGSNARRLR